MLVLSRKQNQSIVIGKDVRVTVIRGKGQVRLGIDAPSGVPVMRSELAESVKMLHDVFGVPQEEPDIRQLTILRVDGAKRTGDTLVLTVGDDETVEVRNAAEFLAMVRNMCDESEESDATGAPV